jgi:hypothetical protein
LAGRPLELNDYSSARGVEAEQVYDAYRGANLPADHKDRLVLEQHLGIALNPVFEVNLLILRSQVSRDERLEPAFGAQHTEEWHVYLAGRTVLAA